MKLRNPVVTLPLRVVMEAVAPPETISTVQEYQQYLINLFYEESAPPSLSVVEKRPIGRPRKESQPTSATYNGAPVPQEIVQDMEKYSDNYVNSKGVLADSVLLHWDQSNLGAGEYRLSNGLIADLTMPGVVGLRDAD